MGLAVGAATAPRTALREEQPGGKAHPPADRSGAGPLFISQNSGGRGQQLLRFPCSLCAGAPGKYRRLSVSWLPDEAVGKEDTRALPSGVLNLAAEE